MNAKFSYRYVRQIPAGGQYELTATGVKMLVEAASAAFEFQIEAGERNTGRRGLAVDNSPEPFSRLIFYNLSATEALRFTVWIGSAQVDFNDLQLPESEPEGEDITALADGGTFALAGYDAAGRRRKEITVTLKPSLAGTVQIRNTASGKLLALIAASSSGGGFRLETDADLTLTNKTGGVIDSTTATPDIAVASTWYR